MICDMCGSEEKLYKVIVEGAELSLCKDCSRFGKVVGTVHQQNGAIPEKKSRQEESPEFLQMIAEDYAEKIRKKRESMGLNQKELAEKLNEKESVVQKIESGHLEPPIELAKKIETLLNLKIIEQYEDKHEKQKQKTSSETFTIGDFIKIRK